MNRATTTPARIRSAFGSIALGAVLIAAVLAVSNLHRSASPSAAATDRSPTPVATTTGSDGALPAGVSVFDDEYAGVARLEPALLQAVRAAAEDAAGYGVTLQINSGWRAKEYQERLLREAISRYGSAAEAARWVATADTSPHVTGRAVDIGPSVAAAWLAEHGAGYGLCRIYRNEPWHYELRPDAADHGCPRMYADPTHDPRLQ